MSEPTDFYAGLSKAVMTDTLTRLRDTLGDEEFRLVTAEVSRRMGDVGGLASEWLRTIGDVVAERYPEAAAAWPQRPRH